MDLIAAALAYAEMGYAVFPCIPGSKAPLTKHGFQDATRDAAQIERWWTQTPNANVAMPTQGLLVVDVDGADNPFLQDSPEKQLDLGNTAVSCTAHGGHQYLFRQPAGAQLRNTSGKLAPKVDTRADGGYIVLPPSVLDDGKQYTWHRTCELQVSPESLPEPPSWLLQMLQSEPVAVATTDGNTIPKGQRNHTLARLAGSMRRVGMSQAEILAALEKVNADRCRPPVSQSELLQIATSIARYEPNQISVALAEGHWEQMQAPTPPIELLTIRQLAIKHPDLRRPVIHGLLREGETMNVISAPKVGKSWLVTSLALSLATGRPWLDTFQVERCEVLLLDNELHPETSAHRIPKVATASGIPADAYADRVSVINLRGQLKDVFSLGPLLETLTARRFKVIILDAFYRFMPMGMDENDNGTMANLYNHLDRWADKMGCCFVLIHHTTKGNQSGKSVTDVGAGAGSQSRATDTHLVLRPHEEEDVVVLDAAVRSWPPVQPMCLRWTFPVWTAAPELNPEQLKSEKPKKHKDDWTAETFVQVVMPEGIASRPAIINSGVQAGLSEYKAQQLLRQAVAAGILFTKFDKNPNRPAVYSRSPFPEEDK